MSTLAGNALANAPCPAFNGVYAGGGLTYSIGDFKVNSSGRGSSFAFSSNGVGGNGFLGYGAVIYEGLYLGGELSVGLDGSRFKDKKYTDGAIKGRLKSKSGLIYNVAGRVGYVFSNFLAYAKVGFEGRSKVSSLDNSGNTVASIGRNGLLLGAGGDYAITRHVFLRAEYNYNFGSRKTVGSETARTPTHALLIGAGYKF